MKDLIPDRFKDWVGKDLLKAIGAMQVGIDEKLKTITGPTGKWGRWRFQWKKIFNPKILALITLLSTAGLSGYKWGELLLGVLIF